MTPALETRRLVLRPLEIADAKQAQSLFSQWDIVKYMNPRVPWPYPANGAYTFYSEVALPAIESGEEWHWTLRLKTSPDKLIGGISLMKTGEENRGFWLGLPWHRQGLMTEASDVVTNYWFEVLKFPVLRVSKAAPNIASRRISEKQGMRLVATEERDYVGGRFPAEVWEITADEWRARRAT